MRWRSRLVRRRAWRMRRRPRWRTRSGHFLENRCNSSESASTMSMAQAVHGRRNAQTIKFAPSASEKTQAAVINQSSAPRNEGWSLSRTRKRRATAIVARTGRSMATTMALSTEYAIVERGCPNTVARFCDNYRKKEYLRAVKRSMLWGRQPLLS